MIKIEKIARYPIHFIKGTPQERNKLAQSLNCIFFGNISEKFKSKEVSFDVFKKTLDETVPFPHSVRVIKNEVSNGGYIGFKSDSKGKSIIGYNIVLPVNKFSGEIPLTTAHVFMHEMAHYFSFSTNPKHVARIAKMCERGLLERTEGCYNSLLYSANGLSREALSLKLDEFLETFHPVHKIEFLQNSRYRLKDELLAFKEGEIYLDLIQNIHKDKICEKVEASSYEGFDFKMKIQLLEEKLAKTLKDYRETLKKRNK